MTTLRNVHLTLTDGTSDPGPVDVEFGEVVTSIRPSSRTQDGAVPFPDDQDAGRRDHPDADGRVGRVRRDGAGADEVIDVDGLHLVPGLIDTHVHLGAREPLETAARAGLTTLVDLGTHPDELVGRLRAERGIPSILSAGSAASAPGSTQISLMGFPAESGVEGPADAARYLDWRLQHGADLLKIIIEDPASTDTPALDVPTLTALVAGARERGLLSVAHAVTPAAFDRGLAAGADILTHVPMDAPLAGSTLERMRERGTLASPTLVMMRAIAQARLGEGAGAALGIAIENVRALHEAGIPLLVGTDANETPFAPVPHGPSLHDEIALLGQAGVSVAEALHGATGGAADALRLRDRGRTATGLRADLVLVGGDPLTDPDVLRTPQAVWIAGERVGGGSEE